MLTQVTSYNLSIYERNERRNHASKVLDMVCESPMKRPGYNGRSVKSRSLDQDYAKKRRRLANEFIEGNMNSYAFSKQHHSPHSQ